jgi:hypothetical protein
MATIAAVRKSVARRGGSRAQITHLLSVGRHHSVPFSEEKVDNILAAASRVLHDAGCRVTLKRIGPLYTFASANTPAIIRNQIERDDVHQVKFEPDGVISVKIVERIEFCRPNFGKSLFNGCSWPRHFRSMIVVADPKPNVPELVWLHEFGHQTGLWHRRPDDAALMSPCPLTPANVRLTADECKCFRKGPGARKTPEPEPPVTCEALKT